MAFHRSGSTALSRALLIVVVVLGAGASDASGQYLFDPLVPAGRLRLAITPSFSQWDTRYSVDGTQIPLGDDLTDPTGALLFPAVTMLQDQLRQLLEAPGYVPSLGQTSGYIEHDVTRVDFGAEVGVFDWLTVGARVPFVKTRTALGVAFRAGEDTDLGLNPILEQNAAVSAYLGTLDRAAADARAQATSVCAAGAGDACQRAQDLAVRAEAFAARTRMAYQASAFFPVGGTTTADALTAVGSDLSDGLEEAGLDRVPDPRFASAPLDEAGFLGLPGNGGLGIGTAGLGNINALWSLGDVELTAAARILQGEQRDSAAPYPRLAWALTGGALVRMGTGTQDDPDVLLDIGTGDGQMDVEGFVHGALDVGRRLAVRTEIRYGVQGSTTLLRRVAPAGEIFARSALTRSVRWSPGSYTDITLSPRYRLADAVSLAIDYRRYAKGADEYLLADPADPAGTLDTSVLAAETEVTLGQIAFGLRYSTMGGWRRGTVSPPIEAGLRVVRTIHGSGGRAPRATRTDFTFRLFPRLWGG